MTDPAEQIPTMGTDSVVKTVPPTVPARSHRNRILVLVSLAILVAVGLGSLWLAFQPSRDQLLEQGLQQARRDPIVAEQTLRRALSAAGGRDSDVEIALCRLLVRRKAFTDAVKLFGHLDLSKCRSDLLLAFARDGLKTELQAESRLALAAVGQGNSPEKFPALELLMADLGEWGERTRQLDVAATLTRSQPENPRYWASRIDLLSRLSLDAETLAAIREALQHDFPIELRRQLQNTLVQQLVNQGEARAARLELAELIRLEGESVRVRGLEVYLCRLEGRLDRALEIITAIVEEAPELPFPRFTRGVVFLDLRKFEEAAADLERVVAAQPFDAPAHFKLSEAYRGLGRDQLAAKHRQLASEIVRRQKRISELFKMREENPRNSAVYRELEQLHRELGDVDAAQVWQQWSARVSR